MGSRIHLHSWSGVEGEDALPKGLCGDGLTPKDCAQCYKPLGNFV